MIRQTFRFRTGRGNDGRRAGRFEEVLMMVVVTGILVLIVETERQRGRDPWLLLLGSSRLGQDGVFEGARSRLGWRASRGDFGIHVMVMMMMGQHLKGLQNGGHAFLDNAATLSFDSNLIHINNLGGATTLRMMSMGVVIVAVGVMGVVKHLGWTKTSGEQKE